MIQSLLAVQRSEPVHPSRRCQAPVDGDGAALFPLLAISVVTATQIIASQTIYDRHVEILAGDLSKAEPSVPIWVRHLLPHNVHY